jgi:hypothetical protein
MGALETFGRVLAAGNHTRVFPATVSTHLGLGTQAPRVNEASVCSLKTTASSATKTTSFADVLRFRSLVRTNLSFGASGFRLAETISVVNRAFAIIQKGLWKPHILGGCLRGYRFSQTRYYSRLECIRGRLGWHRTLNLNQRIILLRSNNGAELA